MTFGKDYSMVVPRFAEQPASVELSAIGFACPWPTAVVAFAWAPRPAEIFPADPHALRLSLGEGYHRAYGKLSENFPAEFFKNKYLEQE
ncbi:hypothetical protein ACVDG5_020515 [Mesorhizobium sp. ORM6]